MLQPRGADVPVLFLVFVVLPLVTYFLLGKWNEAASKKARVNVLAQRAAEEACEAEVMACVGVLPPTPAAQSCCLHVCATCLAPATTRCSQCKSVRYCSGKCQIVHWRRGHKFECQQLQVTGCSADSYASDDFVETAFVGKFIPHSSASNVDGNPSSRSFGDMLASSSIVSNDVIFHNLDSGSHMSGPRAAVRKHMDALQNEKADSCVYYKEDGYAAHDVSSFPEFSSEGSVSPGNKMPTTFDETFENIGSVHQSHKSVGEARKRSKLNNSPGPPILEPDNKNCIKGSTANKKPLHTSGQMGTMSQKIKDHVLKPNPADHVPDRKSNKMKESRLGQPNVPAGNHAHENEVISSAGVSKLETSKKASIFPKCNLVGLINDNRRTMVLHVLFPYEDLIKFFQYEVRGVSPRGLLNCGNSCYANAVLQCLTSTKPLIVFLLQRLHSRNCPSNNWCLMCELEQHASLLREIGGALSPSRFLSSLRNIGCRLGGGSQEDAHEFLRVLVMSMQSACLDVLGGEKEVDPKLQETTLIQQLFGGRLKSKVKCLKCHHESERYEDIMDLTLEIHGWVESLDDALTQFTAPEDLDGENMYRCGRCSSYVNARKQLSIHEVPNILTIVLKRFQTGKYGKINKCVTFPDMLDMVPFVSGAADNPPLYLLYAVVVHVDTENASFSGHYISYVKDMQGTWLRIDDSEVQVVSFNQVMSEGAYMLFYSRSFPRPPRIYIENVLLNAPNSTKRQASKSPKSLKHEVQMQTECHGASSYLNNGIFDFGVNHTGQDSPQNAESRPARSGYYSDDILADSNTSEWSLFTSSDESSFTTESTRDSFSIVDHGDNPNLDPISSFFGPFYGPGGPNHPSGCVISRTQFSPSSSELRCFLRSSTGQVVDASLPNRNLGVPGNRGVYGQCFPYMKDGFAPQTNGFCDM